MKKPSENRPWAKLKVSRKVYETHRPWKAALLSREQFEAYIEAMPVEVLDGLKLGVEAEVLLEAMGFQQDLE